MVWLLSTFFAGWISDRIGRRTTYIIGWIMQLVGVFPLFPLVNTGDIGMLFLGLAILTIGLGFTYGPQAALYSRAVPGIHPLLGRLDLLRDRRDHRRRVRPDDRGGARGGYRVHLSVAYYLAGMTLVGLVATLLLRDRSRIPLGPDHEAEQSVSPIYGMAKA